MKPIERIAARPADLGDGLTVHRALPTRQRRMVGAWCFLDHAGPVDFPAGRGLHVGAHPHIGLQTFTWLIEGEVMHRDSLGNEQIIRPGQVNLMTAGGGIAHTEDSLTDGRRLHAAQLWIALPEGEVAYAPAFEHLPNPPCWDEAGARLTLLAGRYGSHTAAGTFHSRLLGMDLHSVAGARLELPLDTEFEYALLPLEGAVAVGGESCPPHELAYVGAGGTALALDLAAGSRALLIGGEPFAKPVEIWWNFVAFDKAEIARARAQWEQGDSRFAPVGDGSARRLVAPPLPWASDWNVKGCPMRWHGRRMR